MAYLALSEVSKKYSEDQEVVKGFSLEVEKGDFVVLVGPSGCGKSTTLRMIAGLEEITSGQLWLENQLMNFIPSKDRGFGMVFQNYALYPHMTVYKNMSFGAKVHRVEQGEIKRRVQQAAELLGISQFLKSYPKALSGGQKQRVAIGSVMVSQPKLFLMDEPLSNLDAKLRTQMRIEMAKLHQKLGATFIYVTHDQVEAMTLGTKLVVMNKGIIQQVASPDIIYHQPRNQFVAGFIGSPAMNFIPVRLVEEKEEMVVQGEGIHMILEREQYLPLIHKGYLNKELILGFRPHDISLGKNSAIDSKEDFSCQVVHTEALGSEQIVYTQVGRIKVTLQLSPDISVQVGQYLKVNLKRDKMHWFDKGTGESILYKGGRYHE